MSPTGAEVPEAPRARRPGPRPLKANADQHVGDRFEGLVGEFRRIAEERERYRDVLERMRAVIDEALG